MAFNFDTLTLNLFHSLRQVLSALLPDPLKIPFTLHSFLSVRGHPETICIQALATVIQSTPLNDGGRGLLGHQAASVFTMPVSSYHPPLPRETELNSLELNEIMIQHHTILFCLIQRERQQGKPSLGQSIKLLPWPLKQSATLWGKTEARGRQDPGKGIRTGSLDNNLDKRKNTHIPYKGRGDRTSMTGENGHAQVKWQLSDVAWKFCLADWPTRK